MLGMGIVLVCKATRVVSLAHGQILFLGAYFVWLLYSAWDLPVLVAFPIGIVGAALVGMLIERLTMRPLIGQPEASLFLVTLAVFMFLDGITKLILKGFARAYHPPFIPEEPLHLGTITIPQDYLYGFIAAIVVAAALGVFFKYTRGGLGMRITAEDHMVAQSMGIRVKRVFSWAWGISGAVAGVAGVLMATRTDLFYTMPEIAFKGLIVALFGGLESLRGALVGGLALGILERMAAGYVEPLVGGGFRETAAYAFLLLILLVRPYGLFGLVRIERI